MIVTALILFFIGSTSEAEIIGVNCTIIPGPMISGIGATSAASCESGQTLVGCGFGGYGEIDNMGGTWVEPSDTNTCIALSGHATFNIYAMARCCTFPSGVVLSSSVSVSATNGIAVSSTCSSAADTLTGCTVQYTAGERNLISGAGAGPNSPTDQVGAWIDTNNQCNAYSFEGGEVRSGAVCLVLASGYQLTCTTNAKYTNTDGFGECPTDNFMTSCHGFIESSPDLSLNSFFVSWNKCFVMRDNNANQYANAICCQLVTTTAAPTTANPTTATPTTGIPTTATPTTVATPTYGSDSSLSGSSSGDSSDSASDSIYSAFSLMDNVDEKNSNVNDHRFVISVSLSQVTYIHLFLLLLVLFTAACCLCVCRYKAPSLSPSAANIASDDIFI